MEIFNVIVGVCSILSFVVTLFVARKVSKITNINQNVSGHQNRVSGRDSNA